MSTCTQRYALRTPGVVIAHHAIHDTIVWSTIMLFATNELAKLLTFSYTNWLYIANNKNTMAFREVDGLKFN